MATACIEHGYLARVQSFGQSFHESDVHEGLRVAMGVDDDVGRFCVECKSVGIVGEDGVNEALKQEAAKGDILGVRQAELAIIFDEHRVAGGFEKKNGCILRVLSEQR